MSTLGPRTALKSRKISGSLAYILAQTNVKQGTKAATNDVSGCTLEMGADGLWTGNIGALTQAQLTALPTSMMGDVNAIVSPYGRVSRKQNKWVGLTSVKGTPLYTDHAIGTIGGWGATSSPAGVTFSQSTTKVRIPGRPTLKIDASAIPTNVWPTIRRAVPAVFFDTPFEIWFWASASINNMSANIRISSDIPSNDPPTSTPSNYITFTGLNSVYVPNAWNCVRINPKTSPAINVEGLTSSVTGSPDPTKLAYVEINLYFDSAETTPENRIAYIDTATVGHWDTPTVCFSTDGQPASLITKVLPLFRKYGIPGATINNDMNAAITSSSKKQYQYLLDHGFELGCNGQHHTNYVSHPELLDTYCAAAETIIMNAGFPRPITFGYPVGANNDATDAILSARGYRGCRGGGIQNYIFDPASAIQSVRGTSIENSVTSDTILARIDSAVETGSCIVLQFHEVVDSVSTPFTQIATATFTAILTGIQSRVASGLLRVMTFECYCTGPYNA